MVYPFYLFNPLTVTRKRPTQVPGGASNEPGVEREKRCKGVEPLRYR